MYVLQNKWTVSLSLFFFFRKKQKHNQNSFATYKGSS